ncbi:HsmA family protein [Bacteroidota bacterium]
MSTQLIISTLLITLALVFYSIGVWSERLVRYLKTWHVISFWIGFIFDVSGTLAMHGISDRPFDIFEPHTLTGQIALWLMFAHAVWATRVVVNGSDQKRTDFHRYSLIVWIIWLVPYFGGMYIGMY